MDSALDLPPHQPAQSCFIEREVILKWSNQCRTATYEHDVPPPAFLNRIYRHSYSTQLVYDLAKFEYSVFPKNPARRTQRPACESLTTSCRVTNGDRVGVRIEPDLMRSGMSARAIGTQVNSPFKSCLLHFFRHGQQGAGRCVTLHRMMDFPAPCLVLVFSSKRVGGLRDNLPEAVHADREVRTPHQSDTTRLHGLADASQFLKPSRRPRHYRDTKRNELPNILDGCRRC